MGITEILAKMEAKRQELADDNHAIAPLVLAGFIILISTIVITGVAVWQITQRPDITYNITDTGFSLAGLEMDSPLVIIAVIGGAFVLLWLWMRKK